MDQLIEKVFSSLPAVATSPLAFVAYLLVVIAWLLVALKVRRNKQLLSRLEKLPEKDRLKALELEMGSPRLRAGLTPKQWLRHKIYTYYFLAFVTACTLVFLLFAISTLRVPLISSAQADITLSPQSENNQTYDSNISLVYSYERIANTLKVHAQIPYLDLLRNGGPVIGLSRSIEWDFPKLSIKILNNTSRTIYLSEAIVHVHQNDINTEPVLVFLRDTQNDLRILNLGWGPAINPHITFGVTDLEVCKSIDPSEHRPQHHIKIDTIDDYIAIDLRKYIDTAKQDENGGFRLINEQPVCVFGEIQYDSDRGQTHLTKFSTVVVIKSFAFPLMGAGLSSSAAYGLKLVAGKSGYEKRIPLSHVIKAGEADHLLLQVGSDKSCRLALTIEFSTVDGSKIAGKDVELDLFVPRGFANRLKDLDEKVENTEEGEGAAQ